MKVSKQRCFIHGQREAAVRCPQCSRFYCRECVSDFGERLLCKSCLASQAGEELGRGHGRFLQLLRLGLGLAGGLLICWLAFYGLGQLLYSTPHHFHDGTIWHDQQQE